MITIIKIRFSYLKRGGLKKIIAFLLPILFSLLLVYFINDSYTRINSKVKPIPNKYTNLNYSFNLTKREKSKFNQTNNFCLISNNKTILNISKDILKDNFDIEKNVSTFDNYSTFLNYINSKEYNSSNITFNSLIEIIELEKGRKYKFKSNNLTFETTLSRLNKLNQETKSNNDNIDLINNFFYFTYLLESKIGTNDIKTPLIISNQTLDQRPKYNNLDMNYILLTSGFISLSYCFIVFSLFDWIIEEKEKQLNHFLYRQGISKFTYYFSWMIFFMIISIIPSFCTSFIISFFILYHGLYLYNCLIYFLFILNIFGFCFFFVSFVKKVDTGQKIVKLIYIGSIIVGIILLQTGISKIVRIIFIILPNINLMISINLIVLLDNFEKIDLTLLTTKHNEISLFDSFLISIITFIIYIILGTIIISFNEGTLKNLFSNKESEEEEKGEKININSDDKNLTQFDIHHENLSEKNQDLLTQKNCLSIKNVYKIYGDLKAVNNFNGDIFPDEIFCLLGHNGAGKTTLIKMISGLEELDNGNIFLDGISLILNKDYLYKNIGLCTQEDLFFEDLTVEEHLRLMSELKGQKTNMNEIYNLIQSLDLYKKKDDFAKNLSGGQKRKLCIALALIGNSKLILLDEPTSGMDVIAKKQLWKFLEGYKKDKIIILTTHSLDEAEYLGDRIGIMNEGRFICSGTSSYLKNNYPCGYNINILIDSNKSKYETRRDLFNQLKNIDNTAEIKIESKHVFSINFLNLDNRVNDIFNLIDLNSNEYGITNYTVSTTSLEDVFIKLNDKNYSNQAVNKIEDEIIIKDENQLLHRNVTTSSFCKQIWVNLKKNLITLKRTKIKFLIEILTSSIFVIFYIGMSEYIIQTDKTKEQNLTDLLTKNTIYYSTIDFDFNIIKNSSFVKDKSINFKEITNISKTDNISEINEKFYKQMKYHYEKLYIVLKQESSVIKSLIFTQYGESEYYIAATNLIFSSFYEYQTNIKISAFNEISNVPLGIKTQKISDFLMKLLSVFVIWFSFIFFIANMIEIPLFDRYNNVKHLLFLSGENMFAYWIGFIIVDLIKFIIYALILLLILYNSDKAYLYCFFFEIPFFLSLVLLIYCISYVFDNISNANMFYNILMFFGTFLLIVLSLILNSNAFLNVLNTDKFYFNYIHDLLPSSTFLLSLFFIVSFTDSSQENKLKSYAKLTINKSLVFLIQIILYSIILFLLEIRIIQRVFNSILFHTSYNKNDINEINSLQVGLLNNPSSEYINTEKEKVISNKNLTTKIVNLSKTYWICCNRNIRAVRNLNLGLESNEKFGLLGFNGSGKTTTFKCITNQILYDNGEISLFHLNNQKDFEIIRKKIGYCPQENALFDYLNVTDTINYYKELKGISENIDSILERFGLKNYKKTLCKNLSGGNKRKLTFAIALMGNPKIILLDEPSSSVDPESRRGMWKNINLLSKNGDNYNMILTTHSMEEAEVLCDTVSWFKDGNFVCVGNPEKLKIKYSIGYLLQVKFNSIENKTNQDINLSLEELNSKFIINQNLFIKISGMEKIKEYIEYLIGFVDVIKKNIYKIELKDVGKDYSFILEIGINVENKSQFFSQILTMKNKNNNVSEISINMYSLENILTHLY